MRQALARTSARRAQRLATLIGDESADGPRFVERGVTMPVHGQLNVLVRQEQLRPDSAVGANFVAVDDEPRQQFVLGNGRHTIRINHP